MGKREAHMKKLFVTTAQDWRSWLSKNHDSETGIWLVFSKKNSPSPSIDYESAVEEALCFGWIDSIIRAIDDRSYARKFTPRKEESRWSPSNKARVEKLIRQKKMTPVGLAKITSARKSGIWDRPDRPEIPDRIPEELVRALKKSATARAFFDSLAPSHKRQYIGWIATAKRPETREKRAQESLRLLMKKEKLGLK
jgi:uncharacterized protein YdeI (YjbR/CyaY-like superfamily)